MSKISLAASPRFSEFLRVCGWDLKLRRTLGLRALAERSSQKSVSIEGSAKLIQSRNAVGVQVAITVEFTEDARWTLIWRTAAPRPSVQFLVLAVLRARTRTQPSRYSYSSAALYSSLVSDTTSARRSIASTSIRCAARSALIRCVIRCRCRRLPQVRTGSKHIRAPTHERCREIDCDP